MLLLVEQLNKLWDMVYPYLAGITIGGIVSAVFYCLFKYGFNKALKKIDENKLKDEAIEAAKEEVKETTFKVSIQPIVMSEVKKAFEEVKNYSSEEYTKSNEELTNKLEKVEKVLIALGNYFDDSIGVVDSKKEAFHKAVEDMEKANEKVETTTTVEQIKVEPIAEVKEKKAKRIER